MKLMDPILLPQVKLPSAFLLSTKTIMLLDVGRTCGIILELSEGTGSVMSYRMDPFKKNTATLIYWPPVMFRHPRVIIFGLSEVGSLSSMSTGSLRPATLSADNPAQ